MKNPFTEIANDLPSLAVFADNRHGVLSQMSPVPQPFTSNGLTIATMRDLSCIRGLDTLDALGAATKQLHSDMEIYSKSGFATAFARAVQQKK